MSAYNFVLVNKSSEQLSVKVDSCDRWEIVKKFEPNPFFSGTVCYGEAASAGKLDGKFTIAGQSGTVECHFTYEAGAACSPPTFTYTHVCGRLTLIIVGDKPSTHNGSAYVTVMIFG